MVPVWVFFAVNVAAWWTLPALAAAFGRDALIVSGTRPIDTTGNEVFAHGGGMLEVSGTYFWYGMSQRMLPKWESANVNLYSSADLLTWTHVGHVFSVDDLPAPYTSMERPKILYSRERAVWVLTLQVGTGLHSDPAIGFAEAASLEGPFTWIREFEPVGLTKSSMSAYQDDSWQSYLLHGAGARGLRISHMKGSAQGPDVQSCGTAPSVYSPAVFSDGGLLNQHAAHYYYMLASESPGPAPSKPVLLWSTSMCGPWQEALAPAIGEGAETLYDSHPAFVMPLRLDDGAAILLYMGDRWNVDGPGSVGNATYVWLPLLPRRDGSGYEVRELVSWKPHEVVGWKSQSLTDLLLLRRGAAGLRAVARYLGIRVLVGTAAIFGAVVVLAALTVWRSSLKTVDRFEEVSEAWEPLLAPVPVLPTMHPVPAVVMEV